MVRHGTEGVIGSVVNLDFDKSRWEKVQASHRAWWAGTTDQPLIHLTLAGRDPGRPAPALPAHEFTSFYAPSVSAAAIADRLVYDVECRRFLGDAFPVITPNFGPGVIAAFMGLELHNGEDTVWFQQPNVVELPQLEFKFDPDNAWYRRVCDIYREVATASQGLIHLGMTDLGGNLDITAAFRQSEQLALDLYDVPEAVATQGWAAHAAWWRYFTELNQIIQPAHAGYAAWTPLYSETPYYMLQCDFAFMLSREMFDQFAKPELVKSCQRLGNPFFHLDGPGMLTHLDSLLEIPELKGIQWVPGAGQAPITAWPEVYRKIRAAGKRIQFFASQSPLGWRAFEVLADQLGSAAGIMMCGEAPLADEPEIRKLLAKYGVD